MKSIMITPLNKEDFDLAFSLLIEFSKDRKRLSWEDDELSFAFLMKEVNDSKKVSDKVVSKKLAS